MEWEAGYSLQAGTRGSKEMVSKGNGRMLLGILKMFEYLQETYPDKFISIPVLSFTTNASY